MIRRKKKYWVHREAGEAGDGRIWGVVLGKEGRINYQEFEPMSRKNDQRSLVPSHLSKLTSYSWSSSSSTS